MAYKILIVDDEPDIHAVTRISLKNMRFQGQPLELVFVDSGEASVDYIRENPDTAVALMDVVMEAEQAGLKAIETIRKELGNDLVRIILRTGQPGLAPERQVIEAYDIDGYLAKAEMTSNRLFSTVRSALKNHAELVELQWLRDSLNYLSTALLKLPQSDTLEARLQALTAITAALMPSPLTLFALQTDQAEPQVFFKGLTQTEAELAQAAQTQAAAIAAAPDLLAAAAASPCAFADGYLTPIVNAEQQRLGFIYVQLPPAQAFQRRILPFLAAHVSLLLHH